MKIEHSLMTVSLLSICLLAPFARAQSGDAAIPADQKDGVTPTVAITPTSYPTNAGTTSGGGTKDVGASVTVTAKANPGAVFVNWTTNGVVASTNEDYKFTAETNSGTVVANFDWVVTTKSLPAVGGTTSGAGAYTNGQSVTVTATPTNECYDFGAWTKAGKLFSTNANETFVITNGESLVARFTLKEDAITTSSNPAKGGTTKGGGTKGCGTKVTVKAEAAPGYRFVCWKVDGGTVSTNASYSFTADGAEALTANFSDVSVPALKITSPTPREKVDTSLLVISGTATNVLGVGSVVLTLNGDAVSTITTTNNWTNWSAGVILGPGTNVITAYAESEASHPSQTATVTVVETGTTGNAPVALAGLIAEAQEGTNAPFEISFGAATMEHFSPETNQGSGVGNYTYTQTGPDTATLASSDFAPPDKATNGGAVEYLTFTTPSTANSTNEDGSKRGTVTFSPGLDLDVSSPSGWTSTSVDSMSNTMITTYGDGTFTSTDSNGTNRAGGYTSMQYGPMAAMIIRTNTDPYAGGVETNYALVLHTAHGIGYFFVTDYSGAGEAPRYDYGTFTSTYQPTGLDYVAPESLNGSSAKVTPNAKGSTNFSVTFGQATEGKTSHSTNFDKSQVSNYTYTRTGTNTAVLINNDYLPPSNSPNGSTSGKPLFLTFHGKDKAAYTDDGTNTGSLAFTAEEHFAPAALAQGKIVLGSETERLSLDYGSVTNLGTGRFGTYTYAAFSPTVGMLTETQQDPANAGELVYIQLTFSSPTNGSFCATKPSDGTVNLGSFTLRK